jgi:hypothetical protein
MAPAHGLTAQTDCGGLVSAWLAQRLAWSASDARAMRMSSLITTLNPITETTSPARLIQSPVLMVIGSSALIIDRGRAMLTLFLGDTTLGAGPDRRASAVPLPSAIAQPPISQTDGAARQRRGSSTVSPTAAMTATAAAAQSCTAVAGCRRPSSMTAHARAKVTSDRTKAA